MSAIINMVRIDPLYDIILANPVSDCDIEKRMILDITVLRNTFLNLKDFLTKMVKIKN